jgi:hypothetical protein
VVVDEQDPAPGEERRRAVVEVGDEVALERRGVARDEPDGERELAALPDRRDDLDRAALELDELAADRQAQPRAAEPASGRRIGLGERLEQPGRAVGRDPDPGVDDLELDDQPAVLDAEQRRPELDAALLGE